MNALYPDMEKVQESIEKHHIRHCTQKGLDPSEELQKAEEMISAQFNNQ